MVSNQKNFYGSLIKENLNWFKVTTKVKGKTVGNNESIGCLHGKRPWSITFTATTNGTQQAGRPRSRARPSADPLSLGNLLRPGGFASGVAPQRAAPEVFKPPYTTSKRSARWASRSDSESIWMNSTTRAIPMTMDCSRAISSPAMFWSSRGLRPQ